MGEHRPGITRPKMARCANPDCGHAGHRHGVEGDSSGTASACRVYVEPLIPGSLSGTLCPCLAFEAPGDDSNTPLARHAPTTGTRPYFEEWNRLADLLDLPRTTTPSELVTAVAAHLDAPRYILDLGRGEADRHRWVDGMNDHG